MRTALLLGASVPVCLLAIAACGGSDDSKKPPADDGGLEGGPGSGGRAAGGSGGRSSTGGVGGVAGGSGTGGATGGASGAGGAGGSDAGATGGQTGTGGAAGDASIEDGIFFSVTRSAQGLPGSGVASKAPNPETTIYASLGSSPTTGTNVVGVTASDLGLLETDDIDALAVLAPVPANPMYYFSVRDSAHVEGYQLSEVNRSSTEGELPGDLFVSDGIGSHYDGESGLRPGANMRFMDEARLGLEPAQVNPGTVDGGAAVPADDIDALELGVTGVPSAIYFSVRRSAAGASGSGVASVTAAERGCTIFRSALGGANEVAFTCANLGLVPGDEVDALAVQGAAAPTAILFSVEAGSVGVTGSPVELQATAGEAQGDIFRSAGTGTNELLVDEAALGLLPEFGNSPPADELDALAVRDEPQPARFEYAPHTCTDLVPNPYVDGDGAVRNVNASAWVSDEIFALRRLPVTGSVHEVMAYDVRTCAKVGPSVFIDATQGGNLASIGPGFAVIPQNGWTRASPLTYVEIWSATDTGAYTYLLRHTPSGGAPAQEAQLDGNTQSVQALIYRPTTNDFAIPYFDFTDRVIAFVPRPAPTATLTAPVVPKRTPHPCNIGGSVNLVGVDPATNGIEIGDVDDRRNRLCRLDSDMWLREFPRSWTDGPVPDGGFSSVTDAIRHGFIVPGQGMYALEPNTVAARIFVFRPVP